MSWFKTSDGGKAKVSKGQDGSMRYEKMSKPSSGGKHSHSILKTDVSGSSKLHFFGGAKSGRDK